jgi:hypothetical protein
MSLRASVPQIVANLVSAIFAIGLFSFIPGSHLANLGFFLTKITFTILILFALVGIHCPLVYE